jgi:hypothetical protein
LHRRVIASTETKSHKFGILPFSKRFFTTTTIIMKFLAFAVSSIAGAAAFAPNDAMTKMTSTTVLKASKFENSLGAIAPTGKSQIQLVMMST